MDWHRIWLVFFYYNHIQCSVVSMIPTSFNLVFNATNYRMSDIFGHYAIFLVFKKLYLPFFLQNLVWTCHFSSQTGHCENTQFRKSWIKKKLPSDFYHLRTQGARPDSALKNRKKRFWTIFSFTRFWRWPYSHLNWH